ncbi:WAP four-disulfide core domain protein 8 [Echinops telfairi]|uniref:WAP four-disulfide core domain protein 8 n=1 Tax=Echinops telfairi TaxID=9371 RepID=A0AC55DI55_ECHTE|nr:WAP four-disulfide core domain protein 8 [Echinops telfairi]
MVAILKVFFSRRLPRHSSSFSWRKGALLLLVLLFLEPTSASLFFKSKMKPGKCPKEKEKCLSLNYTCQTDFDCSHYLKCCSFNCVKTCLDPYKDPCMLTMRRGVCKGSQSRWYYNSKQKACKPFLYTGCDGNANNFLSKTECKKNCRENKKQRACPTFPIANRMECPDGCKSDLDCSDSEKCCESTCGFICSVSVEGEE